MVSVVDVTSPRATMSSPRRRKNGRAAEWLMGCASAIRGVEDGLHVYDRCPVNRFEPAHGQPKPVVDRLNAHTMQADRVGTVGRPCAEHAEHRAP